MRKVQKIAKKESREPFIYKMDERITRAYSRIREIRDILKNPFTPYVLREIFGCIERQEPQEEVKRKLSIILTSNLRDVYGIVYDFMLFCCLVYKQEELARNVILDILKTENGRMFPDKHFVARIISGAMASYYFACEDVKLRNMVSTILNEDSKFFDITMNNFVKILHIYDLNLLKNVRNYELFEQIKNPQIVSNKYYQLKQETPLSRRLKKDLQPDQYDENLMKKTVFLTRQVQKLDIDLGQYGILERHLTEMLKALNYNKKQYVMENGRLVDLAAMNRVVATRKGKIQIIKKDELLKKARISVKGAERKKLENKGIIHLSKKDSRNILGFGI